jgi:hypothetical protein
LTGDLGQSDCPCTWSPKDGCSEVVGDWKLEAQHDKESRDRPKDKGHI